MSAIEPSAEQQIHLLYNDHSRWLRDWLRRRLGCAEQAADLAHDTFVRVLRHRDQVGGLLQPRAYLSSIARGLVIDYWRRRELEQAWLETLAVLPEAEMPSPEVHWSCIEALIEIDRMLDSLKPAVRNAFLWGQLEGLTCPQIAERLGVSLATAERYVAKALRHCYALRFES